MKAWSSALADEIATWPQVTTKSFFGFTALYRKDRIFGLLPRTRALHSANSIAFKIENASPAMRKRLESHPRLGTAEIQKARWFLFSLVSDADLHGGLDWLGRAYEAAGKPRKNPKAG